MRRNPIKSLFCLTLVYLLSSTSISFAASDGDLDTQSLGGADVSLQIQSYFQISGMVDRNLGTWTGVGNLTSDDDVCVYTNLPSGAYRVIVTGSGSGGALTLIKGGDTLGYEAWWNDQPGSSGLVQVSAGTPLTGQTGANTTSHNCGGGNSASLRIFIPSGNLASVPAGIYTGTVSVQIEAN